MRCNGRWCRGHVAGALMTALLCAPTLARAFVLTPADVNDDAQAPGQTLTVDHEVVTLTLVKALAGFDNVVRAADDAADAGIACLTTPAGFTELVGRFTEPTELVLSLTTPEGNVWTTGSGADNLDKLAHARLSVVDTDAVLVEWEDTAGGGDLDYNDCVFRLTITPIEP
jgi:hypothetical protein